MPGEAIDATDEIHVLPHGERLPTARARCEVADMFWGWRLHDSTVESNFADDRAKQGRFAGAIAAHDNHHRTWFHRHAHVVEGDRVAERHRGVLHEEAHDVPATSVTGSPTASPFDARRRPGARSRRNRRVAPVKTTIAMTARTVKGSQSEARDAPRSMTP